MHLCSGRPHTHTHLEPSRSQGTSEALLARESCLKPQDKEEGPTQHPVPGITLAETLTTFPAVWPVEQHFNLQRLGAKMTGSPLRHTSSVSSQLPWLRLMAYLPARQGDGSFPVLFHKHCTTVLSTEDMTQHPRTQLPQWPPQRMPPTA